MGEKQKQAKLIIQQKAKTNGQKAKTVGEESQLNTYCIKYKY